MGYPKRQCLQYAIIFLGYSYPTEYFRITAGHFITHLSPKNCIDEYKLH